jgi:DNA-directed RNA polymerase specialized sigma24 family protein
MDLLPPSEYGTESIRQSSSAGPLMRQPRDAEYTEYVQGRLPWLRRIAYRLTQDWQVADDITQVAITSLYTHWNRARDASSTDAYARTILVRAFIAECRSPWTRRVQLGGGYPEHAAASADQDARMDVRAALAALPPRQRASSAVRSVYMRGCTCSALTQLTGLLTLWGSSSRAISRWRSARRQDRRLALRPARARPAREPVGPAKPRCHRVTTLRRDLSGQLMNLDHRADRVLFDVAVKWLPGFSLGSVLMAACSCGEWRVVGCLGVREWPVRRAGVRGVSRPRWMQSRSPVALPGP